MKRRHCHASGWLRLGLCQHGFLASAPSPPACLALSATQPLTNPTCVWLAHRLWLRLGLHRLLLEQRGGGAQLEHLQWP